MGSSQDIRSGRLSAEEYQKNFSDMHPPMATNEAVTEAERCLYCYDAPCVTACPTDIPIPHFIKKIEQANSKGAALDILNANILGGTCARVCPVESLCEGACVRHTGWKKPIEIGALQRFATDALFERGEQPFTRAAATKKRVAVVGAGPAGLTVAHKLASLGHDIVLFDAKTKLGGLNEYGLAPYKVVDDFVQKEIDFILGVGGIEVKTEHCLGREITLAKLREEFDSVFLGLGLAGVNALRLEDENIPGVWDAVDYIEKLRSTEDLSTLPVGRRVVVIGGGSTAIDIAVQSKKLGAEDVTLVYRRGIEGMRATWIEREFAQTNGIYIKEFARPHRICTDQGHVSGVEFERTKLNESELVGTESYFHLDADVVFKAIGQVLLPSQFGGGTEFLETSGGRVLVDYNGRTTLTKVFAGGDCVNGGDLTVTAVRDGKRAAKEMHEDLMRESDG